MFKKNNKYNFITCNINQIYALINTEIFNNCFKKYNLVKKTSLL